MPVGFLGMRTVFLADYFVNEAFRRELLRVLKRRESVNSSKRSIYVGRVAGYQAKQHDELQAAPYACDVSCLKGMDAKPATLSGRVVGIRLYSTWR
jgi:Tn3 transposase DDE domain-containing protein